LIYHIHIPQETVGDWQFGGGGGRGGGGGGGDDIVIAIGIDRGGPGTAGEDVDPENSEQPSQRIEVHILYI
jgi:hypothetical protein